MEKNLSPIQLENTVFGFEEDFVVLCAKHGIKEYLVTFSDKSNPLESECHAVASAEVSEGFVEAAVGSAEGLRDIQEHGG